MKTFTFCSRAGSAASRCGWWWKCSSLWHGCSAAAGGVGKHTSSHTVHEQLGDTSNPPWVQQWGHSGQWAVCCAAGYPACAKEAEMKASGIRGLPPAVRRTQRCWGTAELLAHFLAHLLAPAALHQQLCTSSPTSLLHALLWAPATFSNEVTSFLSPVQLRKLNVQHSIAHWVTFLRYISSHLFSTICFLQSFASMLLIPEASEKLLWIYTILEGRKRMTLKSKVN